MIATVVRTLAGSALLLALPGSASAQPLPSNSSVKPPCPVSDDEKYAHSQEQAVQVGGSPVFGAARERRYLDTLRGPEGQPVQYKRIGQAQAPDGTILDSYTVTYAGLEKPVTLYLDWYHYNTPKAPRGFSCAGPFNLTTPPASPFQEMDDVRYVAIAQGETKEFAPIPLGGADPAARRGVAYDRFRLLALASRAAVAKNSKIDPRNLTQMPGTVVVAFPRACGDRTIRPSAIEIVAPNGAVMPKDNQRQATGDDLSRLLHGATVPEGSIAIVVQLMQPRPNDTVRITYAEPMCGAENSPSDVPIAFSVPRPVDTPLPSVPEGTAVPTEPVLVQVLVDFEGAIQRPTYVGGPLEMFRAAAEAVGRWRFEPARLNGAPMASGMLLQVRFVAAK